MKRFRFILVGLLLISALALIPACGGGGGGGDSNSIVGTWSVFESGGKAASGITITFNADGTGHVWVAAYRTTVYGTYTASNGYYTLYFGNRVVESGTYAIDGDVLTMCVPGNCNRYRRI